MHLVLVKHSCMEDFNITLVLVFNEQTKTVIIKVLVLNTKVYYVEQFFYYQECNEICLTKNAFWLLTITTL